ncbi:MAG TPA: sodium:solute symporter family transporter, partial [Candidatus Hypogeohydataceae bacterium YC38]
MTLLDWTIVLLYMVGIVVMSLYVGASQVSQEDYYLGGRRMGPWAIAMSILATQCSSISLIGAPAFIALKPGGGLIWLQYEFALPLAMFLLILFVIPVFHRTAFTTIYEYLEVRFGRLTRTLISNIFLLSRGLATGVSLYATAVVLAGTINVSITSMLLLVGGVSIAYTTIGGIKADIYSDIVQLIILWLGALVCIISLVSLMGGWEASLDAVPLNRARIIDWGHHGLGDGGTYSFWCMLFGALFLYISYYGCDQTQTQRLLTAESLPRAQKALFLNGILRFPLVFTYCFFGLLLSGWVLRNPGALAAIPNNDPDFLVPVFVSQYVPVGLKGLIVAGLLAAAMSSLDSSLNSLSAVTLRDVF